MVMTQSRLKISFAKIKEFNALRVSKKKIIYMSDYGSHFYNYFRLDKIVDQNQVSRFKGMSQKDAEVLIKEIFVITK